MKTLFKLLILIAVTAYLIYAVVAFAHPESEARCSGIEVRIDEAGNPLCPIDSAVVVDRLMRAGVQPVGQLVDSINLMLVDSLLEGMQQVRNAVCYINMDNYLCLDIAAMVPILRVMADDGSDYYIDRHGMTMPVTAHLVDLPLATGHINKQWASVNLVRLARLLHADDYWDGKIEQISVMPDSTIVLIPTQGDHRIRLGHARDMEDKMQRLRLFVEQGLNKVGWNKYSEINLEYNNQIICNKK